MNLTLAQQEAIAARGNVLVVAGAGTGKTRTLVERCLSCLLDESASLDEILMVTFTEAAAAEMRQRIRIRLEEQLREAPEGSRWQEQLALFETAHIGTLHSFCLQLVRQHFYELELDPQLSVLPEEEARLLADDTLEELLQRHYAGRTANAEAVQQLIHAQGRGSDQPIRILVLRLHHYTQTLPDPDGWLKQQLAMFTSPKPTAWEAWLLGAVAHWRERWLPVLAGLGAQNQVAEACVAALKAVPAAPSRSEATTALEAVTSACGLAPRGKKTDWLKPLKEFQAETGFLLSLARVSGEADPLAEDWLWVRGQMATLLQLARDFTKAYTEAKRELGMVDFHDLEQYALKLLWDVEKGASTRIAAQWQQQLRFVFVDEYQDINAAQDKIIEALSRPGAKANRFLVGDVKQSIYRFRLADPHIFQGYVDSWGNGHGQAIPLVDNFRSREGILEFINSLFTILMRREIGGVPYDEKARLRFGEPGERGPLSLGAGSGPAVELHLRVKGGSDGQERSEEIAEALTEVSDMEEVDKEARLVVLRLKELKAAQYPVWDEGAKAFRPVEWGDMAVLLRSPSNKSESYAKEFSRLGVPLLVARGGFYKSLEVSDLLNLLQLLDNPLQDIPTLAVLHSPLVGLTVNELATIRLVNKGHFWMALQEWHKAEAEGKSEVRGPKSEGVDGEELYRKVSTFLERFTHWRRLARQVSLSRCLDAVLSETHYASWLLTQARGEQRHANVQRLLSLALQFDRFQRQSLYRFLCFIEAQQAAETEPEVATVSQENAVRLMSIHQSKGLEFPVVVVADLGKPFNFSDLRFDIILDQVYGLCPQVKPPHTEKRYPSLPYWLARQRQTSEMLGEEMRLLYVAMTRARDILVLTGNISKSKYEKLRETQPEATTAALLAARSYADWMGGWFARNFAGTDPSAQQGQNALLQWFIHDDTQLILKENNGAGDEEQAESLPTADSAAWDKLYQRLAWKYPFIAATRKAAKTSVTVLRRRAAEQIDGEAAPMFDEMGQGWPMVEMGPDGPEVTEVEGERPERGDGSEASDSAAPGQAKASAASRGNANHLFLRFVSLDRVGSVRELRQEAQRLEQEGALTAEEMALLNLSRIAAFWKSDLGRKVRSQAAHVRRELAFTVRFSANELAIITGEPVEPSLEYEFAVVQGAADLVILLPEEIWLIDFKTDYVEEGRLAEKVKMYEPQLRLYARALSKIYRRPVSGCWLYFLGCREAVQIEPVQPGAEARVK